MQIESRSASLANMSAPPRSTVTLPRLSASGDTIQTEADETLATAATRRSTTGVPVGPGGGKLLSNALCLARVELPAAICAFLQMPCPAPQLTSPLGLARALVAIARQRRRGQTEPATGEAQAPAARRELDNMERVSEAALADELATTLLAITWPDWTPVVAFVRPLGRAVATELDHQHAPKPPDGVTCPLVAARLVSALRGAVFLKNAAPSLTHLLNLSRGDVPSGTFEIWLPVQPGRVRPLLAGEPSPGGNP